MASPVLCTLAVAPVAAQTTTVAADTASGGPFKQLPRLLFGAPPAELLPASVVLDRYTTALAALARPSNLTFTFSVEQVGQHDISQTHRVFRAGTNERDETTVADGFQLHHPDVRIFRHRRARYDVANVAPRVADYAFRLVGTQHDGDHDDYVFATTPRAPGPFAVTSVTIDGARYLPSQIDFHVVANSRRGQGRLVYGLVDRYWLVREAEVATHDGTHTARERIAWSGYQFPENLPDATFSQRRAAVESDAGFPFGGTTPKPRPSRPPTGTVAPTASIAPAAAIPVPSHAAVPAPRIAPPTAVAKKPPRRPTPVPTLDLATPEPTTTLLQGPVTPVPLRTPVVPASGAATAPPPPPP